ALPDEVGEVRVGERGRLGAGEVAGTQEEEAGPPGPAVPVGAVAGRAVPVEDRAPRLGTRRAGREWGEEEQGEQRDEAQGDEAGGAEEDPLHGRGGGPGASASSVRRTSGSSRSAGPAPSTRTWPCWRTYARSAIPSRRRTCWPAARIATPR